MKKKTKKIIVNSLTLSRIAGMLALPILFNTLTAPVFLIVLAALLFTDCLDGLLARKFKVSTIGGSILDMSADKLLGISVLIILANMYPVMYIPLLMECAIMSVNVIGGLKGSNNKSSEIGRIKTWIMGLSICSLFIVGLSPEIIKSIDNVTIKSFIDKIIGNKDIIKDVSTTATIVSEGIVLTDYSLKAFKNNNKVTINELKELKKNIINKLKEKDFYKDVLFNEEYNKITKDMSLKDKLLPNEEKKDQIKKLTLKYKNSENSIDK